MFFDTNKDNALNRDEFLLFRHPETGDSSLNKLVDTIIKNLDSDKDGNLKQQEFILIEYPRNEDEKAYYEEKLLEYKSMDRNDDGIINRKELRDYLNPRNERSIKRHAKELIDYVDEDRDGLIDIGEMLRNIQYFIDNKFLEPSNMIHYDL
jgi:Ca2+-binding EF-hand superfamily protein